MIQKSKIESKLKEYTYAINLIASVINSTCPPENSENLSWYDIISFAEKQSVLNILAYAVEKLQNKPTAQTCKYLREIKYQKMIVEAQQEIEASDTMDKLENMKIKHMPLKGYVIKNIYPSPDMRTMGDIDILVDGEKIPEIINTFSKEGFTFEGEGDLHSNMKRGNAYIEFHRYMVDKQYGRLHSYFGTGFQRAKKCDGFNYRYYISHEDMYVFLVAHVAKHYRYGGTGIRTLLDLYIYRRTYSDMNEKYISEQFELLGLSVFAKRMEAIANNWFSGNFDGRYDNVSEYIVSGGVYGLKENLLKNSMILKDTDKVAFKNNRRRSIEKVFFPNADVLEIRYPILKKHRFLTPLFWIIRVFDTLIHEPKNVKGRFKDSSELMSINEKQIDAQRESGIDEL